MKSFYTFRLLLFIMGAFFSQGCNFDKSPKLIAIFSLFSTPSNTPTYTVGGTVSGLMGTLVLQNNGGDDLSLTTNGSFTFAMSVADGASYSVTVLTQPTGQTCSASTNTGIVNSSSITNVSVVCSSLSYTIGGTISGLTGTVVLQNNGADNLSLTANGSFTFPSSIANGSGYSVTVLAQPTGQTCSASTNTGAVSSSSITNVSVVCSSLSYTVGGTISGLSGTVVVQNNGGNNLTLSANGSFTFTASIGYGLSYSVLVITQPSSQICSASSNTGTISNSNITNISIICSSSSHTVGGTVSGLTGTVVLQNNGGDNLTLTANGNFTFATSVASGAGYFVSILTQPSGLVCSASSNTGTINMANITNVSIICSSSSHTVGGTVSGLTGTVVLRNNGGDNLSLTANGSFVFATSVASGAPYSVTIFTQPTAQTCNLSNNTGTINASNVTNVVITCVTNTYTVGGTISGLTGTVVLRNNGGDNLSLTANGGFTFATNVASGVSYSVSIFTQPTGQTCLASSNTGTISSANITNVSITCSNNLYTVGGTVSGLTGTVVLQNNSGDNLSLTTNGGFTFATSVANGAAYSAIVFTQPSGQVCSASSNTGTISAANITNISIICSSNSYTVGGSVSGLVGTVVLRNNGGDNLSLTANGNFTFATSVASGASYTVTVFTQPTGQTCATSSNTGTIGATNVTNVSISCTNNSYTVGGTVSGLSGTVVLQNNSGDNLSLTANGNFTFATSVANGATYSVTVFTQPAGQTCTPSSNTGTISAANVTNVSITCVSMYTVGGTLGGLTSGTLILQNNGGDNLSLTANGNFTFATSIANAATYSVTVLTSPTNRTCIVTNGSGTISAANVTSVTVTCTGNANGALSSGTIINTLSLTGGVTTLTGAPCAADTSGCSPENNGFVDSATPSLVRFEDAEGITTDGTYIYVADTKNQRIRKVTISTGETTTLAGSGTKDLLDGVGTAARFDDPKYLVTDGVSIYVGDKGNKAIRKIVISTGVVSTIISGNNNFGEPQGMVIHNNYLYVADKSDKAIRRIDLATNAVTTVVSSDLDDPVSLTLVGTDIYIADKSNHTIKKTTIGTWTVSTFAGTGNQGHVNGTGTTLVRFSNPEWITTDGTNLYVSDTGNNRIRKIVVSSAVVTTLAGTGGNSYTNSSTSLNAIFNNPRGIVSDGAKLYVMDKNNGAIRVIQ